VRVITLSLLTCFKAIHIQHSALNEDTFFMPHSHIKTSKCFLMTTIFSISFSHYPLLNSLYWRTVIWSSITRSYYMTFQVEKIQCSSNLTSNFFLTSPNTKHHTKSMVSSHFMLFLTQLRTVSSIQTISKTNIRISHTQ
jgi:hypothetical protein